MKHVNVSTAYANCIIAYYRARQTFGDNEFTIKEFNNHYEDFGVKCETLHSWYGFITIARQEPFTIEKNGETINTYRNYYKVKERLPQNKYKSCFESIEKTEADLEKQIAKLQAHLAAVQLAKSLMENE